MKRLFKILAWTGFAIVLVISVLAFVFFLKLPSPAELGKSLVGSASKSSAGAERSGVKPGGPSGTEVAAANQLTAEAVSVPAGEEASSASDANLNVKNSRDLEALDHLMDPEQPQSQVCDQLGGFALIPDSFKYDKKTFGENFKSALFDDRVEKDPMMMAMMAPLRHFLQQPKIQELLEIVKDAARTGKDFSFTEKAEFYAKLAGVYQEMKAAKQPAEALMDRGYHLMMLARAVKKNPSLISDTQLGEYCHKIEQAANVGAPMDWQAEKAEFGSLMETLHVDPKDIGYDPKYQTHLEVEQSTKGVHFRGGWIDDIMPNEEINIGNTKPGDFQSGK